MAIVILSNLLLNSIPEECYVVLATLVLLRMGKQIKFDFRLIVSVIFPALVSNIYRYVFNLNMSIGFIVFIFVMSSTIWFAYNQKTFKKFVMVFVCVSIACVSNALLELFEYVIIMNCSTITEITLKEHVFYAFISTIPYRILEFSIIVLYIKKQKDIDQKIRVHLYQSILNNGDQRYIAVLTTIFNLIWIAGSVKVFVIDKILINDNMKITTSLIILIGDIIVPIVTYISLFFSIYNARARELYIKSLNRDLLISRVNIARYYANKRKYQKVNMILNEISDEVKEVTI